jgi:hypothetical protein
MSKSPSRHLGRLQGKLKLTEKEENDIFVGFYYIFQYFNVLQPISVANLGWSVNYVKSLISSCVQYLSCLNIALCAPKIMLNAITATAQYLRHLEHRNEAFQDLFQDIDSRQKRVYRHSLGRSLTLGDLLTFCYLQFPTSQKTLSRKLGRKSDISETVVAYFNVIFKNLAGRWRGKPRDVSDYLEICKKLLVLSAFSNTQ